MAKISLAQKAYDALLEEIISQRIQPGSVIAENDLAQQYGMSRTPIREALKRLANEGFIHILPHKVAVVSGYSVQEMIKCHEVAKEVDGALAESLTKSLLAGELSAEDFSPLYSLAESMRAACEEKNYKQWVSIDNQFHMQLIELCKNQYIVSVAQQLRLHLMRLSWFHTTQNINILQSNNEHIELLNRICQGDISGAYSIAKQQSQRSLDELQAVYDRQRS